MNVNLKNTLRKSSYVVAGFAASLLPVVAHAEDPASPSVGTNESLINSLVTGFTSTTSDALSGIAKIAPVALPIIGAIIIVTLGIKIFKRISRG